MRRAALLVAAGLVALPFGCRKDSPSKPALPQVASEAEEGPIDLFFAITESKVESDGSSSLHAQGLHLGRKVGLRVLLRPPWKAVSLGGYGDAFKGRVLFQSTGDESDRLVRLLADLYGSRTKPEKMTPGPVRFTAITLQGDPRRLDAGPVKIKIFLESETDSEYAELYTNIDLRGRRLEIREKDPDYRQAVMKALTAPPASSSPAQ